MRKTILSLLVLATLAGCYRFDLKTGGVSRHESARAAWSFILPGIGQIQNEEKLKGSLMLILDAANYATYDADDEAQEERFMAVAGVLRILSAMDAYQMSGYLNEFKPLTSTASNTPSGLSPVVVAINPVAKNVSLTTGFRF